MSSKLGCTLLVVALLVIISIVIALLPPVWTHWLLYPMTCGITQWIGLIVLIVAIVLVIVGFYLAFTDYSASPAIGWPMMLLGVVFVIGYVVFEYVAADVYGTVMANSFSPEQVTIADLGDTKEVRWNAFDIAKKTVLSQQTDPTHMTGDIDPFATSEGIDWIGPQLPNGIGNQWDGTTDGLFTVHEDNTRTFEPVHFACAENGWFGGDVYIKLYNKQYYSDYPEIFYWKSKTDGTWYMLAPIVDREFHFPVFTPVWGGLMVIDSECNVEKLSPQEAIADPRLQGAQVWPMSLGLMQASNWGFRFGGLSNILFVHKGQVEIKDLPFGENKQPFYMQTKFGNSWVIAAEPSGTSTAVSRVFFFDVHSGAARMIEMNEYDSLTGPIAGATYIKGKTPGYTWQEGIEGTYVLLEPRPLTKGGVWYWMYTLTTKDYGGTTMMTLLNAKNTADVLHFCTRDSFYNWLLSVGQPDTLPCGQSNTGDETSIIPTNLQDLTNDQLWKLVSDALATLRERSTK
jgi:hypothetical protein